MPISVSMFKKTNFPFFVAYFTSRYGMSPLCLGKNPQVFVVFYVFLCNVASGFPTHAASCGHVFASGNTFPRLCFPFQL